MSDGERDEDVMDTGMDWSMVWKEEVTEDLDPGMALAMADYAKMNSESKAKSKGEDEQQHPNGGRNQGQGQGRVGGGFR